MYVPHRKARLTTSVYTFLARISPRIFNPRGIILVVLNDEKDAFVFEVPIIKSNQKQEKDRFNKTKACISADVNIIRAYHSPARTTVLLRQWRERIANDSFKFALLPDNCIS